MNNYFKISPSPNVEEAGCFPQSETMSKEYYHNGPFIWEADFTKELSANFLKPIDSIVLKSSAKITDIISAAPINSLSFLVISNRFLDLLYRFDLPTELQALDTFVQHKKAKYNYKLLYIHDLGWPIINFERTEFWVTSIGGIKKQKIEINSLEAFFKEKEKLGHSAFIKAEKLALSYSHIKTDIFRLHLIGGGYYVSQKVKTAIEEAGLTGFRFEPVHGGSA